MKQNRKSLRSLAADLVKLKDKAKALGIFTDDRELLACPRCGLTEDVTCDGLLITYMSPVLEQDSGLRFEAMLNNQFRCPVCGLILREESEQTCPPNGTKPRRNATGRSKSR